MVDSRPYRFDAKSRGFPKVGMEGCSDKFQSYIKKGEDENRELLFNGKRTRTRTEGVASSSSSLLKLQEAAHYFKPVSRTAAPFGYSTTNLHLKKHSNLRTSTLNL
jgi:hypothetical protein